MFLKFYPHFPIPSFLIPKKSPPHSDIRESASDAVEEISRGGIAVPKPIKMLPLIMRGHPFTIMEDYNDPEIHPVERYSAGIYRMIRAPFYKGPRQDLLQDIEWQFLKLEKTLRPLPFNLGTWPNFFWQLTYMTPIALHEALQKNHIVTGIVEQPASRPPAVAGMLEQPAGKPAYQAPRRSWLLERMAGSAPTLTM